MDQQIFLWMRCCGRLNGTMRTVLRGSFEQTEFRNRLDSRIRRGRNLRLKQLLCRADLIQLSQSNRKFRNSQRKSCRRAQYRFCPIEHGIAYWPMEIERAAASISNVASLFTLWELMELGDGTA